MVNCERSPSRKDNPRSKKRIPTYVIRKEEARALEEEVQALHKQLAALQDAKDTASIKLSTTKNQILREYLHTQELAIASTSAMLFNHLSNQPDNPIKAHIHLPKHQAARRETLVNMKNDKFRQCHEYLAARSRSLDMTKDHFSVDQYEDTDGNLICQRFDVTHFHGVKSLKQVYDALVFFMFNIEISISETLAALVLTEELKKSAGSEKSSSDWSQDDSEGEEECVVVMRRVVFTKIHNPNFEVPENALIDISERVTQWAKVMMQAIQDVIDTQS
ncbi:hypothetical protein PC117_g22744 [Phytophthora cactorum]|uniref:Uncharacterized protein n=1 Tax=Phytophthora cactorum TaxID=29920 RepID=A0A8T1BA88_9STRA|nr:hypothetical protein PC117_g22744 [Phytophthora cactorum]